MKNVLPLILTLLLSSCFSSTQQSSQLNYDRRNSDNTQVTSDINFLGKVEGSGSQSELFGIFSWGDSGRANYEGEFADNFKGNEMIKVSKQAAVYNALQGQKDSFLIDPQFRTTDKNFLIFKSTKTEVVGQKASKANYRQIKRFTSDKTDTQLLPFTYSVTRNGVDVTSISASRDVPPHFTDTIKVKIDSGSTALSERIPKMDNHVNSSSLPQPLDKQGIDYSYQSPSIGSQLKDFRQKIQETKRKYQYGLR